MQEMNEGMEEVRAYILAHPEITGGRFSWYDTVAYYGLIGQEERQAQINVRVYSDDISIDTDDRAELIAWTYKYNGFERFFEDPDEVKRKYTSEDGQRLIATFYMEDSGGAYWYDDERYLSADPDEEDIPFSSFEEFKAAVVADLQEWEAVFEFCPGYGEE